MMSDSAGVSADLEDHKQRYLEVQLAGDRRAALALIDSLIARGADVSQVQTEIIEKAQLEIGRLWEQDRISVAQEHVATAISQVTLAHLYRLAPPAARNGRKILIACVPGELHEFPARLLADSLDLAGYDIRFLGADVPEPDLVSSVLADKPWMLALSVTMPFNIPAARSIIERVREATQQKLPIAVGGHACKWDNSLCAYLKADITGDDARKFVAAIDEFRHDTCKAVAV